MKILFRSLLVVLIFSAIYSCEKTTFVGSDIFVPGSTELLFKEDFDIIAKTVRRDSFVTYDLTNSMPSLLVGKMDDPYFGVTEAELYIDLHINSVIPQFQFEKDGVPTLATLDSAMLVLGLDSKTFYGDSTTVHDVEVALLENKLIFKDTVYSTFQGVASSTILANESLVPSLDSVYVVEPSDSIPKGYAEQMRIRIADDFIEELIQDTSLVSSDNNFTGYAPGIRIKSTPATNGMWGIDINKVNTSPNNSIIVYYKKGLDQLSYRIFVDGTRTNYVHHDYTGSVVESFFDDTEKGDSLLFLQGLAGTDIELEIPGLADASFGDFLMNKAELEFYVMEDETSELYSPLESIILQKYDGDGNLIVTEDVRVSATLLNNISFGGNVTKTTLDGKEVKKYTAAMSIHALEMFDDPNPDTRVVISARGKRIRPQRSIIFGPGHSTYPMKFKLTYSK